MLELSYKDEFGQIIAAYRSLPEAVQSSPMAFTHFVNAVFSSEPTDSALYKETIGRLDRVLGDYPYTLAYWKFIDGDRHDDPHTREPARGRLLELLDDYALVGEE
jgi:hypothetical protein